MMQVATMHGSLLMTMLGLAMVAGAAGAQSAQPGEPVTAGLSPEVRALLVREMQAVAEAMGRIHRALVTGDHGTVADEAARIHDSFVLAQELTDAQRSEIATGLPDGFIAADRDFHELAARLSRAGEEHDSRLQRVWFDEMTRACQACHAEYAAGRFPGLGKQAAPGHE